MFGTARRVARCPWRWLMAGCCHANEYLPTTAVRARYRQTGTPPTVHVAVARHSDRSWFMERSPVRLRCDLSPELRTERFFHPRLDRGRVHPVREVGPAAQRVQPERGHSHYDVRRVGAQEHGSA